jgi:hypothetical protein
VTEYDEGMLQWGLYAAATRHPETVVAPLDLGAGPNAPNGKGRTALEVAASGGFDVTVALLRARLAR